MQQTTLAALIRQAPAPERVAKKINPIIVGTRSSPPEQKQPGKLLTFEYPTCWQFQQRTLVDFKIVNTLHSPYEKAASNTADTK